MLSSGAADLMPSDARVVDLLLDFRGRAGAVGFFSPDRDSLGLFVGTRNLIKWDLVLSTNFTLGIGLGHLRRVDLALAPRCMKLREIWAPESSSKPSRALLLNFPACARETSAMSL